MICHLPGIMTRGAFSLLEPLHQNPDLLIEERRCRCREPRRTETENE